MWTAWILMRYSRKFVKMMMQGFIIKKVTVILIPLTSYACMQN